MKTPKIEKNVRTSENDPQIVYLIRGNRKSCPNCGKSTDLERFAYISKKGNNATFLGRYCNKCNRQYIRDTFFINHPKLFFPVNIKDFPEYTMLFTEAQEKKRKILAEVKAKEKKNKELFRKVSSAVNPYIQTESNADIIPKLSLTILNNIGCIFYVSRENDNNNLIYFLMKTGSEIKPVSQSNIVVIGKDSQSGQTLLNAYCNEKDKYFLYGTTWRIIDVSIIDNES